MLSKKNIELIQYTFSSITLKWLMSKFVDILEGMNLSPPGVFGLDGVLVADLEAIKINRFTK